MGFAARAGAGTHARRGPSVRTTHARAQMAEALRPGAQPLASGPRGSPEVSQTGTPSSANPNRPASAGRVSFGSMDGVTAQMRLHAAREKHRGEEPDAAHMREVFARAVPAAVAQNTRWDNMATELRRACATMRDGLTHSLRDVEERQRVLEASIPALEAELKEVRNKGAESLEYSEKFFDQVRASHRGLRPPAACLPVARPPPHAHTRTRAPPEPRGAARPLAGDEPRWDARGAHVLPNPTAAQLMAQVQAKKVQVVTDLKEQVSAKVRLCSPLAPSPPALAP